MRLSQMHWRIDSYAAARRRLAHQWRESRRDYVTRFRRDLPDDFSGGRNLVDHAHRLSRVEWQSAEIALDRIRRRIHRVAGQRRVDAAKMKPRDHFAFAGAIG